jgi:hypothetical protein
VITDVRVGRHVLNVLWIIAYSDLTEDWTDAEDYTFCDNE